MRTVPLTDLELAILRTLQQALMAADYAGLLEALANGPEFLDDINEALP